MMRHIQTLGSAFRDFHLKLLEAKLAGSSITFESG